jgi:hypothetical protein
LSPRTLTIPTHPASLPSDPDRLDCGVDGVRGGGATRAR